MVRLTIGFAFALILLGLGGYFGTGRQSWTALIPAIAGVLLLVCGMIASEPTRRMHAMHGAVLIALIGFIACVPGVISLGQLLAHGDRHVTAERRVELKLKPDQIQLNNGKILNPVATYMKAAMAALLAPYVGLCVKSFIDAGKARRRAAVAAV